MTTADYVIVGAGAAGCVMAGRLSEAPGISVVLLEAGGTDRRLTVRMPAAVPFAYMDPRLGWPTASGPEPHLDGRMIEEKRGRVIGGSTSINAMIFNRGNPGDYDGWAQEGLTAWGWADVLPVFRRMETFSEGGNAWRGDAGPVKVSRCPARHDLYDRFVRGGEQAGFAVAQDHNAGQQEGMHIAQAYVHGGVRWSAAMAYLHPARSRTNLTVLKRAQAARVLFDGDRVRGVELTDGTVVTAEREVILCAGAFGSPHLLLLSGVGPADELRAHGLNVVADNPHVGRNLENHPGVNVQFATRREDSLVAALGPLGQARLGLEWLMTRRGLGASNFFEAGAFLRTDDGLAWPNVQFEFLPLVRYVENGRLKARPGFQFWMDLSRPASRGSVSLRSADPLAAPRIVFNHLAAPEDRRDLVAAVKLARQLVAQPTWDGIRGAEIAPGPDVSTDADVARWLSRAVGSSYHPSGSCRMAPDPARGAVDSAGRVFGVSGLRVVDAAIMPRSVTANLSAPIIMMAEYISQTICEKS